MLEKNPGALWAPGCSKEVERAPFGDRFQRVLEMNIGQWDPGLKGKESTHWRPPYRPSVLQAYRVTIRSDAVQFQNGTQQFSCRLYQIIRFQINYNNINIMFTLALAKALGFGDGSLYNWEK